MTDVNTGLRCGLSGQQEILVTAEMTAARFGNVSVQVVATPYLIWLLEGASVRAVEAQLAPGEVTVGTVVDVRHEAAVPIGTTILARSRLIEIDRRRLVFEVAALHRGQTVMTGRHERRIVNLDRFMIRARGTGAGSE